MNVNRVLNMVIRMFFRKAVSKGISQMPKQGADCLHLVDLDGARDGKLINGEAIRRIVDTVDVTFQLGGGIRDETTIQRLLDLGLDRLVVGSSAVLRPAALRTQGSGTQRPPAPGSRIFAHASSGMTARATPTAILVPF